MAKEPCKYIKKPSWLGDEMLIMPVVVSPPGAVEEGLFETPLKRARQSRDIEYF